METDQAQAGAVRQPGGLVAPTGRTAYKAMRLTENEALGAYVVDEADGQPSMLFIATKRPDEFPVGARRCFRNKLYAWGWTIVRHDPLEWGRTHIVCKNPQKIYDKRRPRRS